MPLAVTLCALAAAGLIAVGALALFSPERLARSYGVAVKNAPGIAFVRATGARDAIIGLLFAAAVYVQEYRALLALCGAGLLLSLADFSIAFAFNGRRFRSEFGAHIGGAIGFAVLLALLFHAVRP